MPVWQLIRNFIRIYTVPPRRYSIPSPSVLTEAIGCPYLSSFILSVVECSSEDWAEGGGGFLWKFKFHFQCQTSSLHVSGPILSLDSKFTLIFPSRRFENISDVLIYHTPSVPTVPFYRIHLPYLFIALGEGVGREEAREGVGEGESISWDRGEVQAWRKHWFIWSLCFWASWDLRNCFTPWNNPSKKKKELVTSSSLNFRQIRIQFHRYFIFEIAHYFCLLLSSVFMSVNVKHSRS